MSEHMFKCTSCGADLTPLLAEHETGERAFNAHGRDCPALYRAEVDVGEGVWHTNALRFDTEAEAKAYAADLHARWTLVRRSRVVTNDTPLREATDA